MIWLMALLVTALFAALGFLLGWFAQQAERNSGDGRSALIERVNQLLPQTQCAQCQYPGCRPYATAIVDDNAPINQCPPGGEATIQALADLLGQQSQALNTAFGETQPEQLAYIDESSCIGCTLCIDACPVDAIVGASRHMHTVIEQDCTGCELCLPPCPVDCIELRPLTHAVALWQTSA